jgi:hypothetical protein
VALTLGLETEVGRGLRRQETFGNVSVR